MKGNKMSFDSPQWSDVFRFLFWLALACVVLAAIVGGLAHLVRP